jgi:hypothetical protein
MGDAFLEGMTLLQQYPIQQAGGIDAILLTASELAQRREDEVITTKADSLTLGARLRTTMWKGFTNQVASPQRSPVGSDNESGDETGESTTEGYDSTQTQTGAAPSLTNRLATSVWRGITNQSAMDPPVTPMSPARQEIPTSPMSPASISSRAESEKSTASSFSGIWGYAEKLKDSDAAASLFKASSNWRARAALGSWKPTSGHVSDNDRSMVISLPSPTLSDKPMSEPSNRRESAYSPPVRPAHFKPPRDSFISHDRGYSTSSSPGSPRISPIYEDEHQSRGHNLQASLASLTGLKQTTQTPKAGPRPLLLGSGSSSVVAHMHSRNSSQAGHPEPRPAVYHRASQSSVSSLSPSDALSRLQQELESPSTGRKVPLNRRSVSPMAPSFRRMIRPPSQSSSGYSSDKGLMSPPARNGGSSRSSSQGWEQVDDSSPPVVSPPPKTPLTINTQDDDTIRIQQFNSGATVESPLQLPKKPVRKKTPPPQFSETETSDATPGLVRSRARSKKGGRPANLRLPDSSQQTLQLAVESIELDPSVTPKVSSFEENSASPKSPRRRKASTETQDRQRKLSGDATEPRPRKISNTSRTRKVSAERRESKRVRDSGAEEGDDEGYDDLLSAYESEEGTKGFLR